LGWGRSHPHYTNSLYGEHNLKDQWARNWWSFL